MANQLNRSLCKAVRGDGEKLIEYLIRMAMQAAKSKQPRQ